MWSVNSVKNGPPRTQTLTRKPGVGATVREVAPFAMRGHYSRTLGRSRAHDANSPPWNQLTFTYTTKLGRKEGSNCTGGHHLGPEKVAVVRSRWVAAKQGFLMYYTKGVAIGTEVSVRYKESGRFSGWSLRGVPLYTHLHQEEVVRFGGTSPFMKMTKVELTATLCSNL